MPIRKISEPTFAQPCYDQDHNPPSHMVLQPGTYEHTCPSCGKKTVFMVPGFATFMPDVNTIT